MKFGKDLAEEAYGQAIKIIEMSKKLVGYMLG